MGSVVKLLQPITKEEIEAQIKKLAQDSSKVFFTYHAQERMEERDITSAEVLAILKEGFIDEEPIVNYEKGSYEAKMIKRLNSVRDAGVVTAVIWEKRLVIITVEWEDL